MEILFNGAPFTLDSNSTGIHLSELVNKTEPHQSVALKKNGSIVDLSTPIESGDKIELIHFDSDEGRYVFWHTCAHVLAQAIQRLHKDAVPTIGPPIKEGFYYDFSNLSISADDFKSIEKEVTSILKSKFIPEKTTFSSKEEAIDAFKNNPFKVDIINNFDDASPITAYKQGEFFDLCRGPHLPTLGKIKAFKLLKTSAAYWKGDSANETLTRIYAIGFPSRDELKQYLFRIEEAKKRDHRIIGQKLRLFSFKNVAPGMPFIHPKGMRVINALINHWRSLHEKEGYEEIKTPAMLSKELWEQSGHWSHYKENMYTSEIDKTEYAIKPMNCPGCMLFYKSDEYSYRQLPLRIAEIGNVHRHEMSGSLSGLFRVRSFHQDDAHVFMKKSDISSEIVKVLGIVKQLYSTFGLTYSLELSTRPEKSKTIGTDEEWDMTTNALKKALDTWGAAYTINEGDGAFYGPKIDLHIHDAIGRSWQCGTIQLDMSLPEKFDLHYKEHDGTLQRPIMIHRAIYGSIERFFAILTEHFAGRFPLWMSQEPIRVIPVSQNHIAYAESVKKALEDAHFHVTFDESDESVSKKVRSAQLSQVNYMIICGDKEVESRTLSVRTRQNKVFPNVSQDMCIKTLQKECVERSLTSLFEENAL